MSDTPRTDAEVYGPMKQIEDEWVPDFEFVKADFARELERENAKLRAGIEKALSLAAFYQGVFSNPNFTDHHGDAYKCEEARKYFAALLGR